MKQKICRDPRHIGCRRLVAIKKQGTCRRCYQWLRDHHRIQCRPYVARNENTQE